MTISDLLNPVRQKKFEYLKDELIMKTGMKIGAIAAVDKNYGIGLNNSLPWEKSGKSKLSSDMAFFKVITENTTVVMGRNTYESIGKPLSNRLNIVVSSTPVEHKKVITTNSIEGAIVEAIKQNSEFLYFIGGEQIYRYIFKHNIAKFTFLTFIDAEYKVDKHFPKLDEKKWERYNLMSLTENDVNLDTYLYVKRSIADGS